MSKNCYCTGLERGGSQVIALFQDLCQTKFGWPTTQGSNACLLLGPSVGRTVHDLLLGVAETKYNAILGILETKVVVYPTRSQG